MIQRKYFQGRNQNSVELLLCTYYLCPQGNQINTTIPSSTCSPWVRPFPSAIYSRSYSQCTVTYHILQRPTTFYEWNRHEWKYKTEEKNCIKEHKLMSLCAMQFFYSNKTKKEKKGSQIYWIDFLWMKVDDIFSYSLYYLLYMSLTLFSTNSIAKSALQTKNCLYAFNKRVTEQFIMGINLLYYYWPVLVTTAK